MNETIAAIATAYGNAPVSMIRVSGKDALAIVQSVFRGKDLASQSSHTLHYGHIESQGEIIDEVIVALYKAPKTFTGEDVVEISCHGGVYVTNRVLECLIVAGARMAEPGEFTKRAYLNKRIDLTQAEAVMDMIESQTASSLKLANHGLMGETKRLIEQFKQKLLECIAKIEVNIDYPEYETELELTNEILKPILNELLIEMEDILTKAEVSRILKYGVKTAIIGKPNVGKSSLLNALLRQDKAIVTNVAGTTRDIVEGDVNIGGIILHLMDTAGVRITDDVVEKIGVDKTIQALKESDLVILVFDYGDRLDENDIQLLNQTQQKKRIIVINKNDLQQSIDLSAFDRYLLMSSFNRNDIVKLEKEIKKMCHIDDRMSIDASYIGNARHLAKLKQAKDHLMDALTSIQLNFPIDIANIDIRNAWRALGEIIGEVDSEQLINELFSKFCLGK